jgi:hypothetical protein
MTINTEFKNSIADLIEDTRETFEEKVESIKRTGFGGIPRLMMGRYGLSYDFACRMVVECVLMREPYLARFLRGEISREEWHSERDAIDDYTIRKYTGMLH